MSAPLFEKNARVAFIGDSITHTSPLSSYVQEYYWRHLPSHRVKVFNLGIGGDTAEGTLGRLEADVMRARPTEAVIMLGTNDINYHLYKEAPTEAERAAAEENARRHLAAMRSLVEYLHSRAIPVTLCSSIGRDELTPPRDTPIDGAQRSYGATARLRALFDENCRALAGMLKGTVDYMTPFQALQAATLAVGAPSLFTIDRIHASPLGQRLMARIFLAAQGLPVALPTAEMLAAGWQEAPLTPAIADRFGVEQILRNIRWVDPHQADKTEGLDLEGRIAYWTRAVEERCGLAQYDWAVSLYRVYLENARNEEALVSRLEALTNALYE